MRKVIFISLIIIACNKGVVNHSNDVSICCPLQDSINSATSNTSLISASFICQCGSADYYRGLVQLSGADSTQSFFIVFSAESAHVTTYKKLLSVDDIQKFRIDHLATCLYDSNLNPTLYIVRGKPTIGELVINKLAVFNNPVCAGCFDCLN